MHDEHEAQALDAVRRRLEEHFPELDPSVVEAAVRVSHAQLTGPIRDFVPLLVEKAARDRLAFAVRGPAAPGSVDTSLPSGPSLDSVRPGAPALPAPAQGL